MPSQEDVRFVAHFDMLGMSTLTKRDPDIAWNMLSALCRAREERLSLGIQRLDTNEVIADQIRTFTFSDTVVAFSKGSRENDALAMVMLMIELFTYALHLGIPLRGGIAHGQFKFNFDMNLFSGPALVDAYELGESAQWLGIVLDQYTADSFSRLPVGRSSGRHGSIVAWDVPCKDGASRRQSVANWPESHRNAYVGPVPLTVQDFYAPFESMFGAYESLRPDVAAKYANTVAFFNAHHEPATK
ncbi:MAG: hypothetical protein QG638_2172 [Pseudomonadota bacterium]|nr:hypothetical protein [Pseudomonadota bacterium]